MHDQNQPPPIPCESSEACHGAAGPPPGFQTPGSAGFQGPGNPKPKPRCPKPKKGAKAKKGCAKGHHKHHKHKGKHAKKKGRAAR